MHKEDTDKLSKSGQLFSPLYLDGYIHEEEMTIDEFIPLLLSSLTSLYITKFEDNRIQCDKNKERSLGDLFRICSFYYPEVRLDYVKQELLLLKDKLVGHYCPDIRKRVYVHSTQRTMYGQCSQHRVDEFRDKITYLG